MNDVVWLSEDTFWDQTLIRYILKNKTHHYRIGNLKEAIVVIPTEYQDEQKVNKELSKLEKCIVICTSDEENKFDLSKLSHPNMKLYATYPHETSADVTWLPIGYTPHSKVKGYREKTRDIYFAGQINHDHRRSMAKQLASLDEFDYAPSAGFAQGLDKEEYINRVRSTKVSPAPRGNISPDSFRMYEALEHGSLPIPEDTEFFNKIFGHNPLSTIDTETQWVGYCLENLQQFPKVNNRVCAWWQRYKCDLYNEFNESDMTVVIPVSPIKSHPHTRILQETIDTIRVHTDAQIIVTFDGVRKEQEDRRKDYELFINNFLSSGNERIYPLIFEEHTHQSGMMKEALNHIKTPYILYVEQDTPLTPDRDIEWDNCKELIRIGEANLIRFHFEAFVPEPHKHMMIGDIENGFLRTVQWSQRPQLASTAYYRRVMNYFSDESKSFIEDYMHGVVHNDYLRDGLQGWAQHRLYIYHPDGDIKRSYHTDGREGVPKWDDTQTF